MKIDEQKSQRMNLQPNSLIELIDVAIKFPGANHFALDAVSLTIHQQETLGLLAPSGTGKSLLGNLICGFLPAKALPSGKIRYHFDETILEVDLSLRPFQFPPNIRQHIAMIFQDPRASLNPMMKCGAQVTEALWSISNKKAQQEAALTFLERVQLEDPPRIFAAYPHQLSGGQQQRVLIAIALAKKSKLLIADEPTTALDPQVQKEILTLIQQIKKEEQLTILWATHNQKVMNLMADRIFDLASHQFIQKSTKPRSLAQHFDRTNKKIVLSVTNLSKTFQQKKHRIKALDDISFQLREGEILGIIGQSGSGKSTLAKILTRIETPDQGSISFAQAKNGVQLIFQNPANSLEPTMLIVDAVNEVIKYNQPNDHVAKDLLIELGIDESLFYRFPSELSGGQQQRVAIAKSLATNPTILILDEPTASLDEQTANKVNDLIKSIATNKNIAMIYISHELRNIYHITHNTLILNAGKIIEQGTTQQIFDNPKQDYTRQLIALGQ